LLEDKPVPTDRVTRRELLVTSAAGAMAVVSSVPCAIAAAGEANAASPKHAFTASSEEFPFDTGPLCGVLQPEGKPAGLKLVDAASGTTLSQSLGVFSYYRFLATDARYEPPGRVWPNKARLLKAARSRRPGPPTASIRSM